MINIVQVQLILILKNSTQRNSLKRPTIPSVGNTMEQLELSYLLVKVEIDSKTFEKCLTVSTKTKYDLLLQHYDQAIPLLYTHLKEMSA